MGKGSKNSTPQTQTIYQSNFPPELAPYAMDVLNQGEALANQGYMPYLNQRLADTSAATADAYKLAGQMGDVGQGDLSSASQGYGSGMTGAQQAAAQAMQARLTAPQMAGVADVTTGAFTDPDQAAAYMNPYIQNVIQSQLALAQDQYGQQTNQRNAQAVQAGAFGGDRAALLNQVAQRDYNLTQNKMISDALSGAYSTGLGAYQTDAARRMAAAQGNQQAGLTVGQKNLEAGLTTQGLNAQNYNTGISNQINAAGLQNQIASQQAALAQQRQAMAGAALNAQYAAGQSQEAKQQAGLDVGYQDYLRQTEDPQNKLNMMSGLLHGFNVQPVQTGAVQSTFSNPVTQLVGGITSAAGLANAGRS